MKVTYPIDIDENNIDQFLGARNQFGYYPVGYYNSWHGGLHIEGAATSIKAIADGRIIAFRFAEKNTSLVEDKDVKFSKGFVLMQHDYESELGNKVTFYSLYYHLMSEEDIKTNSGAKIPNFLSVKEYVPNKEESLKGLGVYEFTKKEKGGYKKGKEVAVIPTYTKVTLVDQDKEDSTIKYTFKRSNGKYVTYTYKKIDYIDLNKEERKGVYLNVGAGICKEIDKDTYQVIYKKDTDSLIKGVHVKESAEKDAPVIKVIPKTTEKVKINDTEKGSLKQLEDGSGYVNVNHLTRVNKFDEGTFKKNEIIACDIYVDAGEVIGNVGLQGFVKKKDYRATHIEVFTTDDAKAFIENSYKNSKGKKDGEDEKYFAKIQPKTKLKQQIKTTVNVKKGTLVRVTNVKGNYLKIDSAHIGAVLEKDVHIKHKSFRAITYLGEERSSYTIVANKFDEVNKMFGGILKPDTLLYYNGKVKRGNKINLRSVFYISEVSGNKNCWINKSAIQEIKDRRCVKVEKTSYEIEELNRLKYEQYQIDLTNWQLGQLLGQKKTKPQPPYKTSETSEMPVYEPAKGEELYKEVEEITYRSNFKKGDVTKTLCDITEGYLVLPKDGKDAPDIEVEKEVMIDLRKGKKVPEGKDKKWVYITCNYFNKNAKVTKKGWILDKDLTKFSAYDWTQFGFKDFDAGSERIYSVQDQAIAVETTGTAASGTSEFIETVWNFIDEDGDELVDANELKRAYRSRGAAKKFSRMVCKHKSEWSYTANEIQAEVEEYVNIGIEKEENSERREKFEQQKNTLFEQLSFKVDELYYWHDTKALPYTPKPTQKPTVIRKKKRSFVPNDLEKKETIDNSVASKTEDETPERKFPTNEMVWHFHPIAFVEHMKLITGGRAPWMEIVIQEAIEYKGLDENTGALAKAIQEKYHTYTGHPNATGKTSWCASFASWCLGEANFKNPKSWSSQSFLKHSSMEKIEEPQYGAIVIFTDCKKNGEIIYDKYNNSFGHVAFIVGELSDGKYACLGGNQGHQIKVTPYDCSGNVFAKNRAKTEWRKMTGIFTPKRYSKNSNDEFTDKDRYKTVNEANKKIIKSDVKTSAYERT